MYVDSLEKEGGALIGGGALYGEFTVNKGRFIKIIWHGEGRQIRGGGKGHYFLG